VRFAVFAAGATLDDARAVTGVTLVTLQTLVAKCLIDRREQPDGSSRLVMLETIRQFALERLARDPGNGALLRRHLEHYRDLAETAAARLSNEGDLDTLRMVDADIDNLTGALRWALEHADALALSGALGEYWISRSPADGLRWLDAALAVDTAAMPTGDLARAHLCRSELLHLGRNDHAASLAAAQEALALYRQAGDHAGSARALMSISNRTELLGDESQGLRYALEACAQAQAAGDDSILGGALANLALFQPPPQRADTLVQADRLLTRAGHVGSLADAYLSAAYQDLREDRIAEAMALLARAQAAADRADSPVTNMLILGNLGLGYLFSGDLDRAREAFAGQLQLCREHVVVYGADEGLIGLAAVTALQGQPQRAATLLGAARRLGYPPAGDHVIDDRLERDCFAHARADYGESAWRTAETAGGLLPFDDALAYALDHDANPVSTEPTPRPARPFPTTRSR
jgi:tetratricopeptide (TPR) repeat protein